MAVRSGRAGRLAGFALIAAVSAAPARAENSRCGGLRAVLDADNGRLASIGLRMDRVRGVAILAGNRPVDLPLANECTLASEAEVIELTCRWASGPQAEATAAYDRLVARIRSCLGADAMAPATIYPAAGASRTVQGSRQEIERNPGNTTISLSLVEYAATAVGNGPPPPIVYHVELSVERWAQ